MMVRDDNKALTGYQAHRSSKVWPRIVLLFALLFAPLLQLIQARPVSAQSTLFVNRSRDDGLVAYWRFDENGGSKAYDFMALPGTTNLGELLNGAAYDSSTLPPTFQIRGRISSLKLNGQNSYVSVPDNGALNLFDRFTLAVWARQTPTDTLQIIYSAGSGPMDWFAGIAGDNRVVFGLGTTPVLTSTTALVDGQWHHIAVVKNGSGADSLQIYIDGTAALSAVAPLVSAPGGSKRIGQAADGTTTYFGNLDELRLYKRALSATAIGRLAATKGCADDGSSWAQAFTDLTCAIEEAPVGGEIWVARGLYVPGSVSSSTYQLRGSLHLYGGFAGAESSLAQRTQFVHPAGNQVSPSQYTILSGRFGLDNLPGPPPAFDHENVSHVIVASGAAVPVYMDGFVIRGGHSLGGSANQQSGAGLLIDAVGNLTLSNSSFVANQATGGGGLASASPNLKLQNISFISNTAVITGGALLVRAGSPSLSQVYFSDNVAEFGGALAISGGKVDLSAGTLMTNTASAQGGAVYAGPGSQLVLRNSLLQGNQSLSGGALAVISGTATVTTTTVQDNQASQAGGAIYALGSTLALTQTAFAHNHAGGDGGALALDQGAGAFINRSSFSGNSSSASGGALWMQKAGTVTVVNSLMVGNFAITAGGAIRSEDSSPLVANSTIVSNVAPSGPALASAGPASPAIYNSILWHTGSQPVVDSGGANTTLSYTMAANPGFMRVPDSGDGSWSTTADNDYGDLHLRHTSPAIDAGYNSAVPAGIQSDYDGTPRFLDLVGMPDTGSGTPPIVDQGAYEYASQAPTAALAGAPYTGAEGSAVAVSAAGSFDPDGDIATYEWDCDSDGTFDVTAAAPTGSSCLYADDGLYTVQLRVTDKDNSPSIVTTTATITNVTPALSGQSNQNAVEGVAHNVMLGHFSDPGADANWQLAITWGDNSPDTARAQSVPGDLGAQPHTFPDNGVYSVTISVTDKDNATGTAQLQVTVSNAPPVALDDTAATEPGQPVTIAVLVNDSDVPADPLAITAVGKAAHGAVSTDGTFVTYRPTAGFEGEDQFTYTVSDDDNGTAMAKVTVTVAYPVETWFLPVIQR